MSDRRARVGLLLVGHVDPRAQSVAGDYPELFGALLAPHADVIELVPYAIEADGRFPQHVRECDGWICSPSRSSVYDDDPWIAELEAFHREIVATETPYVGICFGHQLLAQALGGRVQRADAGWGVGVHEYTITEHLAVMDDRPTFALLASHQDQVVEVPSDARVIATSAHCPVAGVAVGERAWTIQGHPEFVPELAGALLDLREELIGLDRVNAARATLAEPLDRQRVAGWIARTFTSHT